MLPCLTDDAINLLVGTADERYRISPEYFRNTHYPQILHRYHQYQLIQEISEQALLDELLSDQTVGNRLYAVLGSTGSGKSELLCWLKDQCEQRAVQRPVIRISRSELNPQILIRKCYQAFGLNQDALWDESRWELLLQKPVTLVNQIIWMTLAEFFETDEEVVPLALLLRSTIEKNIVYFSEQVSNRNVTQPLQILSREQFEALSSNMTLPVKVEYAMLHQSLSRKLDHFLFHGQHVSALFRQLSEISIQKQIRPLLLIDDLVQSVNLYAAELLDHLLNLEEGNWDVVMGLTPGALQDSNRGVELIQRIVNLDTIDDRIRKLWLSDDTGQVFYSLRRGEAVPFLEQYLLEVKKSQGYECSVSCEHADHCSQFLMDSSSRLSLLPFHENLVMRMFDGIQDGKGKLRYLLYHAKEILKFLKIGDGESLHQVRALVDREEFVSHPIPVIKMLSEWYVTTGTEEFQLPLAFARHFGQEMEELHVAVRRYQRMRNNQDNGRHVIARRPDFLNPIREWIEGGEVNPELLQPIRVGVASLVEDLVRATALSRPFTSRNTSVIQRSEVVQRVQYPISLGSTDRKRNEIVIERNLAALEIAAFQHSKGTEKAEVFESIADEPAVAEWVFQGEMFRNEWRAELENVLRLPLEKYAYQFRKWTEELQGPFSDELRDAAEEWFRDWFLLRENVVDAWRLSMVMPDSEFTPWSMAETSVLEKYRFEEKPLLCLVELDRRRGDLEREEEERKTQLLLSLFPELADGDPSLSSMLAKVEKMSGLRLRVTRHLRDLLCEGRTTLPRQQWKGIIRDLEKHCPAVASRVRVQLIIDKETSL